MVTISGVFSTEKYRRDEDDPEGSHRAEFDFPPVDWEEGDDAFKAMDKIAQNKGASIPQIALAWLLHQPGVTGPIIGAKKMSQLKDNLASTEITLSQQEVDKISETTKPKSIYPQWMVPRMNGKD